MHLVAISELGGPIDAAIGPLAAELGTTAYELRLVLNAGFPAVVSIAADENVARAAFAAISRHGHSAVAYDRRDVIPSERMTSLRDFRLENDRLVAQEGSSDWLGYDDIAVLLRAQHRTTSETLERTKERKLRPAMALATGGLVMSKTYGYPAALRPPEDCYGFGFHDTCTFYESCIYSCEHDKDCPSVADSGAGPECRIRAPSNEPGVTFTEQQICVLPCASGSVPDDCPEGMHCGVQLYGFGDLCMWPR
jgi:hypothetical protein